ncbi:Guanine nucleotide-binding protein, beta subunit [Trema orientale]|uniref:Guanine nucleotide-binding protein, beta subunit n=1 Tax=Trema orientale TaxID=63057 RepID=A0A2P5EWQ8_TREOI|nr:Guanine nucleotide-binding protein, beta subunit [Trema orientale]
MKQNILGAKRYDGTADEVLVFDCGKLEDGRHYSDGPELRLIGEGDDDSGLAWDPVREGSTEGTIDIFDLRTELQKLFTLSNHEEDVTQVEWDPSHENILASASCDRKVIIWDLNSRIGSLESKYLEDNENEPPELLFSHRGHRYWITEVSWNKNEPWVISSVSADETLQVWKIAECALTIMRLNLILLLDAVIDDSIYHKPSTNNRDLHSFIARPF